MAKSRASAGVQADTYNPLFELVKDYNERNSLEGSHEAAADWSTVDPKVLYCAVLAVCRANGAIMFGKDRTNFLYYVAIFVQGQKLARYFHPVREYDDLCEWLTALAVTAE
jgi:hypothetical protein